MSYCDQQNYTGFRNWEVVSGSVDLVGRAYPIVRGHSQGAFVDMVGSDGAGPGKIQTRVAYYLKVGDYELIFKLAGNHRQKMAGYRISVSIPGLLDKTITVNSYSQLFTAYRYGFHVTTPLSGKRIIFEHQALPPGAVQNFGLLLDDVILRNTTSGETLLSDDFNTENAC